MRKRCGARTGGVADRPAQPVGTLPLVGVDITQGAVAYQDNTCLGSPNARTISPEVQYAEEAGAVL